MTTPQDLSSWFDNGVKQGATHMLVVCDTFDYEDYPVYSNGQKDTLDKYSYYNGSNMQKVMEVYDLAMSKDSQMKEHRALHLPRK